MDQHPLALLQPETGSVSLPQHPIRVLGIDLGTTNSTVAEIVWNPGDSVQPIVRCLEIEQQTMDGPYIHLLVPSVVALQNGQTDVGEGAKRLRAQGQKYGLEQNRTIFYDCKNDIGTNRTYHRAPEGFRTPAQIGSHVLSFLKNAALADDVTPIDGIVVTVPASFQVAQRQDTVHAAELAEISLHSGDLLDEPIAAFLDYLISHAGELLPQLASPKRLLVFDFGGGTCDVAIFRLQAPAHSPQLNIAPLSVSRYHRLGGGDIDAAILYEALLPQLLAQNGLDASP